MYLPRTPKKQEKDHPMQVQNSEHFLRTAAVVATLTCIAAALMSLRKVQMRQRQSEQELGRKRNGQRVVIIGAGAGGCAAAALLTSSLPDVRVTVIEKDRRQTFQGQVPLAHVGHRSYDLGTTTGVDPLRSPATWNVTRDANLVAAEVLRIDPAAKKVYVRSSQGMLASAKPLSEEDAKIAAAAADAATVSSSPLVRWWRGAPRTPSTISVNEDGSPNLADGTTVFVYDALIVAAGAQRTVGHLRDKLLPQQIDSYRIAVNPGTTRDGLATIFSGNIVHVKLPPASFVWQMEAARALLAKGRAGRRDAGCATLDLSEQARAKTPSTIANSTTSTASTSAPLEVAMLTDEPTVLSRAWSAVLDLLAKAASQVADLDGSETHASLHDEVALRLADETDTSASLPRAAAAANGALSSWPLFPLSKWCMHFSSRQHDSTFVSSTNTIWKYLWYYNKLSLCQLFTITADLQPIGPAPRQVNEVIERFWRERQLGCRLGDPSRIEGDRFHILYHSYVTSVDNRENTVTLYDYKNNAEVRVPFHLLVLDLPLRAPSFVRRSGLHRTRYVEECVQPALAEATRAVAAAPSPEVGAAANESTSAKTGPVATATTAAAATRVLRSHPLLGKTKAELETIFADEMSFMDVDSTTLQHRRYPDVFAIGDVAGLPSLKSYGAVFAQVPVVVHNVRQALKAEQQQQQQLDSASYASSQKQMEQPLPRANARYTGYSSFHVVMTTWRAMWPEMQYTFDPYAHAQSTASDAETAPDVAAGVELLKKAKWDVVEPLAFCNHHIWNNLAWRDPRGFINGLYYQSALYELMYFFVFSRGQWHSPTWFSVPTFSSQDGTPSVPSLLDVL